MPKKRRKSKPTAKAAYKKSVSEIHRRGVKAEMLKTVGYPREKNPDPILAEVDKKNRMIMRERASRKVSKTTKAHKAAARRAKARRK